MTQRPRPLGLFRRRRRREGAAAVEFAIVAGPFFFVIFAVLELGVVFLIDSMLESSVQQATRLVRTGQAQNGAISQAEFRTAMCDAMGVFAGDCENRAQVDVRPIPRFRDPELSNPIVNGAFDVDQTGFDPGAAGTLILVRVWYQQPLATPMLSRALTRLESGDVLLSVTTAFRNEPF